MAGSYQVLADLPLLSLDNQPPVARQHDAGHSDLDHFPPTCRSVKGVTSSTRVPCLWCAVCLRARKQEGRGRGWAERLSAKGFIHSSRSASVSTRVSNAVLREHRVDRWAAGGQGAQ